MPARKLPRMRGGALQSSCPPGVWCMDNSVLILSIVALIAVVVGAVLYLRYYAPEQKAPVVIVKPQFNTPMQQQQAPQDPRFAPLAPEQS